LSYITPAAPNFVSITDKPTKPTSQPKMTNIRLFNIRTKLQAKKLPKEIIKRIEEATNESLNTTVESAINKWNIWCSERNMDPIHGSLREIIKFLNDMCDQQKVYNTIASYRSAISEIHNHVNRYLVGRYLDIIKFMIAIRKTNHPPPHSDNAIDIVPSLDFIISLEPNDNMTILNLWLFF
ncbi:7096_t:CDS:1, partial [Gigaspora margarita]